MKCIKFDDSFVNNNYNVDLPEGLRDKAVSSLNTLLSGTGAGSEFTGWLNLPKNYNKEEFSRIKAAAEKIRQQSQVLVVIGIGGSYLGARAAIEFLKPSFGYGFTTDVEIIFAGNQLSTAYTNHIIKHIGARDFSINVISKSGTTTEPAVAFRFFKELAERKYGSDGAKERIYATTDKSRGALKTLADSEGYETFVVPDDIGGRFSVLTAVGLLPIAAAGCDIERLMAGADSARICLTENDGANDALAYAVFRNYFLGQGKTTELLSNFDPSLHYLSEWWKQLFGESEGKDGKGIFPASVDFTTDLHSMGQYIQDGARALIETVLELHDASAPLTINKEDSDLDGLNYLEGKPLSFINDCAKDGTIKAHLDGGVPVSTIKISERSEFALGELFYFFEISCAVSGYMLGVNPFNQPGVEAYKKNMFKLLGKPGV